MTSFMAWVASFRSGSSSAGRFWMAFSHAMNCSLWLTGRPMSSMKIVVGYGSAKSALKSQAPASTKPSINSPARWRTLSSRAVIRPGENTGASNWRHRVCSGGSSISGIHR